MFKNIIFDWSGVIREVYEAHIWVVERMIEKFGGKPMTPKEIRENWDEPYMKFWNKYFPDMTLEQEQKAYVEGILDKNCPLAKPYPEIVKLIKKLRSKNFSMAVLSGDMPETLLPEMKRFGLENIFDDVIAKVHGKLEPLEKLMEKNNFKKEETVFIGDSNHEIEAGKEAGIKTIAVTWGFHSEEKLKGLNPDYLVHNVKELENILLK
ncbi:MAG: HAD-IA family hydrolase [Candidatus Staskawiczbacteria bacterium]|nr:HAD-IA family hydrolase [Candidatus Staskawiczbacteria bacterium]